jgi:hypothetical protein
MKGGTGAAWGEEDWAAAPAKQGPYKSWALQPGAG